MKYPINAHINEIPPLMRSQTKLLHNTNKACFVDHNIYLFGCYFHQSDLYISTIVTVSKVLTNLVQRPNHISLLYPVGYSTDRCISMAHSNQYRMHTQHNIYGSGVDFFRASFTTWPYMLIVIRELLYTSVPNWLLKKMVTNILSWEP